MTVATVLLSVGGGVIGIGLALALGAALPYQPPITIVSMSRLGTAAWALAMILAGTMICVLGWVSQWLAPMPTG